MQWITEHLAGFGGREAFVHEGRSVSYEELLAQVRAWQQRLDEQGTDPKASVAVIGDYSPEVAALLLALCLRGQVIVPLTSETRHQHERFFEMAHVSDIWDCSPGAEQHRCRGEAQGQPAPELLQRLHAQGDPGLVLFTSGTTGASKGSVLNLATLLERYRDLGPEKQRPFRTAIFLKLDHIGGLNTLFATLFNGGTAIPQSDRSVAAVCAAVQAQRIELLPTTPTFLNMLLFSNQQQAYDLGSLRLVTYGTEPMPPSTLAAAHRCLPGVRFKQTYGSTELGIFSTQSEASDSLWISIGDSGTQTKVHNGTLWVRSRTAMLGYLNAPNPFDSDGWFDTGDQVEVKGNYLRILGRRSELINVGGEKVFPAEIESVLLEMPNVREAVVYAKPSPVTGHIVAATLQLHEPEERAALMRRITSHCGGRMQAYKVPKFIAIADQSLVGARLKKIRSVA